MSPRAGAVLLDLDGTLYYRQRLIPGAASAVRQLRGAGLTLRFLTNTDSKPASTILAELYGYGLDVGADELFTPVVAAQQVLAAHGRAHVYSMVTAALAPLFARFVAPGACTHVVVGDCRDALDYELLDGAFRALWAGAQLLALQRGRYFASADGDHIDTGGVVAALEYSAGVSARVLGKPSVDFFTLAAGSAGMPVEDCVVIGDDPTTDIAGGRAAGAGTVQVRTGKYAREAMGHVPSADHTVDSVADLPDLLADRARRA